MFTSALDAEIYNPLVAIRNIHVIYHFNVQVEAMLLLMGFGGRSLVAEAALARDKTTFEAVLTILRERLQPNQVRYRLFYILLALP